jgi:Protein of unknown function (DUF1566)
MTKTMTFALVLLVLGSSARLRANAPPGRYTIAADTVRDNATGLTWQRMVQDVRFSNRTQASAFCDTLVLAGFIDWRLPNIVELVSLVDDTRISPAIDVSAFPNAFDLFWTSSSPPGKPNEPMIVNFNFGNAGAGFRIDTNPPYVLCVR